MLQEGGGQLLTEEARPRALRLGCWEPLARAVRAEGAGAGVGWTLVKVTSLESVYWVHTLVLLAVHPWAHVTTIHVPVLSVKWAENIPTA